MSTSKALVLLILLLLATSCSDDGPTPPPAPAPTMISDVGLYVSDLNFEDHPNSAVYDYEGVRFQGDLELADWEYFKDVLSNRLEPGEPYLRVTNYLVFPEVFHDRGVMVETCTEPVDWGCQGGNVWSFVETADGWGIIFEGYWWMMP